MPAVADQVAAHRAGDRAESEQQAILDNHEQNDANCFKGETSGNAVEQPQLAEAIPEFSAETATHWPTPPK